MKKKNGFSNEILDFLPQIKQIHSAENGSLLINFRKTELFFFFVCLLLFPDSSEACSFFAVSFQVFGTRSSWGQCHWVLRALLAMLHSFGIVLGCSSGYIKLHVIKFCVFQLYEGAVKCLFQFVLSAG